MKFRFEVPGRDGLPLIVFEERWDASEFDDFGLITTYCHPDVAPEEWARRRREAFGAWMRHTLESRS